MKPITHILSLLALTIVMVGCSTSKPNPTQNYKPDNKVTTTTKISGKQQKELVKEAERWIGTPYKYGGHAKDGTDCSGFVMEVFNKALGVKLPRTTRDMADYCKRIDQSKLQVGDLVFFATSKGHGGVSHVGLYVGDGQIIHASSSRGVIRSGLEEKYYTRTYHSSGRVPGVIQKEEKHAPKQLAEDTSSKCTETSDAAQPLKTVKRDEAKAPPKVTRARDLSIKERYAQRAKQAQEQRGQNN